VYCRYPFRDYQLTVDVGLDDGETDGPFDGETDGTFEGDWLGP